jgi:hypothetical protein
MGHNQKTAKRLEWIQENRKRANDNARAIAELRKNIARAKAKRDRELLELERRILGEIQNVENHVQGIRDAFELHARPWYRKALDGLRRRRREEEDIGQEADGRADGGGEPVEADAISDDDPRVIIDEAHEIIDDMEDAIMDRLHDPELILERMEKRLAEAKAEAVDILENQELDQEERATLLDRIMDRIESLQARIDHQKITIAGFREEDDEEKLEADVSP